MSWENLKFNAAIAECDAAEAKTKPSYLYLPKLTIDGNKWCALYGENLQDGVAGFGDSPAEAMGDFNRAWFEKLDGKCSTCQENAELTDQLKRLSEDLAEKQALLALQHQRTLAAQRAWQESTGNTHWPDLGQLIDWLMEQANINTNTEE